MTAQGTRANTCTAGPILNFRALVGLQHLPGAAPPRIGDQVAGDCSPD
jgi:hypothetical protein